jgi:RimJ/RimL family protein N-acetyltransferase
MKVTLRPVVTSDSAFLYDLLAERTQEQSISHRRLPEFEDHCAFVDSDPYHAWYVIEHGGSPVGHVYLSRQDEIGIFVYRSLCGHRIGRRAVAELIERHPRKRYLANINPRNDRSRAFFCKLGFSLIQNTYELRNA